MRPIVLTATGVEAVAARVNYRQQDFKVGFGVDLDSTGTFTVYHTFDDPADFNGHSDWVSTATWLPNGDSALIAGTANADGNYMFPVQGIKLDATVNASTIKITILQA